jgi:hypothetical protein
MAAPYRWRFNARKAISVRERTAVLFESGFNILDQHLTLSLRQRADVEEETSVVMEAKAYAVSGPSRRLTRLSLDRVCGRILNSWWGVERHNSRSTPSFPPSLPRVSHSRSAGSVVYLTADGAEDRKLGK